MIGMDEPPARVLDAIQRLEAAMRRGDPPGSGTSAVDSRIVMGWLEAQERKYPTSAASDEEDR